MSRSKRFYDSKTAKALTTVNEVLNTLSINNNNKVPEKGAYYNCWGFVAGMLNWVDHFHWVSQLDMERHLKEKSTKVEKPAPGDIAVWRVSDGTLAHTSIVLNKISHLHKPGGWSLRTDKCKTIKNSSDYQPYYGVIAEFRRPLAMA